MREADVTLLARYQEALLEALATASSPDAAIAAVRDREDFAPLREYVESFEPRAVEVGMILVRQWGGRARAPGARVVRAAVLPAIGAPFELHDLPMPEPGPGQVAIRVRASGICGTDVHLWQGRYPLPLPIVPGHEPVGVVEALGDGVTALSAGDRVGVPWAQAGCGRCASCARGRARYCADQRSWITNGGAHADVMIAEASGCVLLPDDLDWEVAAPVFCAGFTVMSGFRRAAPRPGDRVAVLGLGGLGHFALQIAKTYGHEVVVVTSSESKRRDAVAMGADDVVVVEHDAGEELAAAGGADIVLGTSSSMDVTSSAIAGLRPEGRLVTMALPGDASGAVAVDPALMILGQLSIVGALQDDRGDLDAILQLVAKKKVVPRVETYPIGRLNDAMMRLASGRVRYRAVIVADD